MNDVRLVFRIKIQKVHKQNVAAVLFSFSLSLLHLVHFEINIYFCVVR